MKRLVLGLCAALGAGCAGGTSFTPAQLPADPIALVYRKSEDVEKVQKQLDARREQIAKEKRGEIQRARPALGSIAAVRESLDARAEEAASIDLMTRMALYSAPDERTTDAEFGAKGDRPLAWSADHQRLLFLSERTGQTQLFEWNRQTDAAPQLTSGEDPVLDGCYGPQGEVAYSLGGRLRETPQGVTGGMQIWVRRPGGGAPQPVTPGPIDIAPSWSPTDPLLVYQARAKDGTEEILAVNPNAPGQPRFLARGRSPVFTPDGKWIVYSSRTTKGWKLAKVRPDGSGRQIISGSGAYQEVEPAISPDGKWIVYVGYYEAKPGETDLVARPLAGGKDRKLDFDEKPHRTIW